MFKQKTWCVLFAVLFLGLAAELFAPEETVRVAAAAAQAEMVCLNDASEPLELVCTEDVWKSVYQDLMYGDLALMSGFSDHIVRYHERRFVITEDDYRVLLQIVEAEAGTEDLKGRMLVANVILNRLEIGFGGDTISAVVFDEGQFSPVADGRFFTVVPSEKTVEAVERVLDGEDYSDGALYFMCREKASKRGARWFDRNLKLLFKHGGHEFYAEKD